MAMKLLLEFLLLSSAELCSISPAVPGVIGAAGINVISVGDSTVNGDTFRLSSNGSVVGPGATNLNLRIWFPEFECTGIGTKRRL
jgi:hypothetical protein